MLTWDPQFNLGHLLTAFGFLFTGASVLFAGWGLRRNATIQRADFLLKMTERYFKDDGVRTLYYRVDWRDWTLDSAGLPRSENARLLDRLLYMFDEIGQLLRMGVLDKQQASLFAFQASRVLRNKEVQKYLALLDRDYQAEDLEQAHADARYLLATVIPGRWPAARTKSAEPSAAAARPAKPGRAAERGR